MDYAKIIKRQTYDSIQSMNVDNLNEDERNALLVDGWKEVKYKNEPISNSDEYFYVDKSIVFIDGEFIGEYAKTLNKNKCISEISRVKKLLADTDYKVVKNMEYQMAMMTSVEPNQIILDLYDPQELHNERQALRDKINELEQLLKQ